MFQSPNDNQINAKKSLLYGKQTMEAQTSSFTAFSIFRFAYMPLSKISKMVENDLKSKCPEMLQICDNSQQLMYEYSKKVKTTFFDIFQCQNSLIYHCQNICGQIWKILVFDSPRIVIVTHF